MDHPGAGAGQRPGIVPRRGGRAQCALRHAHAFPALAGDNVRHGHHPQRRTVLALLESSGLGGRKVAVEVNGTIVPRSLHAEHALKDGDRIEIVHALGGG